MAHFAELDGKNFVLRVLALDNSMMENEQGDRVESLGVQFLQSLFGADTIWKQTSYNTHAGIHYEPNSNTPSEDQTNAFRKNYAGIGWTYDQDLDAFINPKPQVPADMEQYVYFDEFACLWVYNPPPNE
jgi:hypothetical protein